MNNRLLQFFFFIGLVLQVLAIDLFRVTLISTKISLGIYFGVGVAGYWYTHKMIPETGRGVPEHLMLLVYACVFFGGTAIFSFLAINYYFAQNQSYTETHAIVESGSLAKGRRGSCNAPYAVIKRNGLEKDIIFNCGLSKEIAEFKSVKLEVEKGFLGYAIIKNKELIE